jgi:outer membrane protein
VTTRCGPEGRGHEKFNARRPGTEEEESDMSFQRPGRASAAPVPFLKPLVVAAVLACGAAGASAQSLSALYEAARGYDPTYLGARATFDSAQYTYDVAKALNRPVVSATVQGGAAHLDFPDQIPRVEDTRTVQGTLTGQVPIFNRQNSLTIDQAERAFNAARDTLALAEEDLLVRFASAYFDVLSSAAALETVLADKRAISEQLASAKRNFEVGNATITDTREAQARYDLAIAQEVAARADLLVKKVTLDQLVGRTGVVPLGLPGSVTLPAVLPSQAEDWVRLAKADNPSLHQAQFAYEVAQLQTQKDKAGHLPTVGLTGSYSAAHGNSNIPVITSTLSVNTAQVGIIVNIPIYSGMAVQNQVLADVRLEEKARTDVQAANDAVVLGTRTAFVGAQAQAATVKALEAAESSSRLALEATQLGYKVGVRVNLDVLNAQSQLASTVRDLYKARYDYLLATLKLRQAAGTLTANDIDALNSLLTVAMTTDNTPLPTPAAEPMPTTVPVPQKDIVPPPPAGTTPQKQKG